MRIFTIVLPETPERTDLIQKHFAERGVNAEYFTGINAQVAGLSTEHTYEVDNPGTGFKIGYKPTGIWLSHYMLWGALSIQQTENRFMILETDAKFDPDWKPRVIQALRDAPPDFDFLFIGSCCCKGRPQRQIKGNVYEVKWPACNHAYIINKKCLPYVLNTLRKVWAPIDLQTGFEVFEKLKVYTVLPRIVSQFDTDIPL